MGEIFIIKHPAAGQQGRWPSRLISKGLRLEATAGWHKVPPIRATKFTVMKQAPLWWVRDKRYRPRASKRNWRGKAISTAANYLAVVIVRFAKNLYDIR